MQGWLYHPIDFQLKSDVLEQSPHIHTKKTSFWLMRFWLSLLTSQLQCYMFGHRWNVTCLGIDGGEIYESCFASTVKCQHTNTGQLNLLPLKVCKTGKFSCKKKHLHVISQKNHIQLHCWILCGCTYKGEKETRINLPGLSLLLFTFHSMGAMSQRKLSKSEEG